MKFTPANSPAPQVEKLSYEEFLSSKTQLGTNVGFAPLWTCDSLFDFQQALTDWAIRKGRGALFADCGLGKSPIELTWSENILRKTNKPVLVLTPLAVSSQMVREAEKFKIECRRSPDGKVHRGVINVTNYERLHYFNPDDFSGVVCDESSILKSFDGKRRRQITAFLRKIPYRLLGTATAAPNDYIELGTSSEALGHIDYSEMLTRFFKNDEKLSEAERRGRRTREGLILPKWYLRAQCPWIKRNSMPESVTDRPGTSTETIFLFSKAQRYFYNAEAVKMPVAGTAHDRGNGVNPKALHNNTRKDRAREDHLRSPDKLKNGIRPSKNETSGLRRYEGFNARWDAKEIEAKRPRQNASFSAAVHGLVLQRGRRNHDWFMDSWQGLLTNDDGEPLAFVVNPAGFPEAHFATFPPKLVEPCILAGCPEGGTVLDPFAGAGTTGLVALRFHRNFIGIELKPEYAEMANRRIEQDAPLFNKQEATPATAATEHSDSG